VLISKFSQNEEAKGEIGTARDAHERGTQRAVSGNAPKQREYWGNPDVDGKIILERILETDFFVRTVMNFRFPRNLGKCWVILKHSESLRLQTLSNIRNSK
jgi:hypothetical protein